MSIISTSDNKPHPVPIRRWFSDKPRVLIVGYGITAQNFDYSKFTRVMAQAQAQEDIEVGDYERLDYLRTFGAGSFDAVIVGDIFRTMLEPSRFLRQLGSLASGGSIFFALPRVDTGAHALALEPGTFSYQIDPQPPDSDWKLEDLQIACWKANMDLNGPEPMAASTFESPCHLRFFERRTFVLRAVPLETDRVVMRILASKPLWRSSEGEMGAPALFSMLAETRSALLAALEENLRLRQVIEQERATYANAASDPDGGPQFLRYGRMAIGLLLKGGPAALGRKISERRARVAREAAGATRR